eukprot:4614496-Ditylum_brightwellii.AAC.1
METAIEPKPVHIEPEDNLDITTDTKTVQEENNSEFGYYIQTPVKTIEEKTKSAVTQPSSDQDHHEEIS